MSTTEPPLKLLPDCAKPPQPQKTPPRAGKPSPYSQCVALQAKILEKCANPETTPHQLAAMARGWCELEERKRILRGVPLPGQYRPDLHPDQLLKQLKRAKLHRHQILDAPSFSGPRESGSSPASAPASAPIDVGSRAVGAEPEPQQQPDARPTAEPDTGATYGTGEPPN